MTGFVPNLVQSGFTPKSTTTNRTHLSIFKSEEGKLVCYSLGGGPPPGEPEASKKKAGGRVGDLLLMEVKSLLLNSLPSLPVVGREILAIGSPR